MSRVISSYDRKADVLYVALRKARGVVGAYSNDGIIVRRDAYSGEPVGVTVMDFHEDWSNRRRELAAILSRELHLNPEEFDAALNS